MYNLFMLFRSLTSFFVIVLTLKYSNFPWEETLERQISILDPVHHLLLRVSFNQLQYLDQYLFIVGFRLNKQLIMPSNGATQGSKPMLQHIYV